MSKSIRVQGAKVHNLKNLSVEIPARPVGGLYRTVGIGQVVTGLRHHLRRGPASLRREPLGLRPPVPRPDGQARRRVHRGAVPGDLDRPEDGVAQPPLDGRHHHRDPRLPATALRAHRRAVLPQLRQADHAARRPSRSSTRCWRAATASDSWCWRRWSRAARASTARCSTSWRARGSRACASTAS